MRLTLRTLLAYLDELLEPTQAEELSQKIRESDFASGLVHRIRNSMGRLRVSSPAVQGTGLANDANSVAQYLDNELGGDRVSDFERICLESDMHLAEVASCHQILTLVLGEPAQISDPLRARIYAIPHKLKESQVPAGASTSPASPPPVDPAAHAHPVDVQLAAGEADWQSQSPPNEQHAPLHQERSSTLWIPAAIGIFVLGVAAAYFVLDQMNATPVTAVPENVAAERQTTNNVAPPSSDQGNLLSARGEPSDFTGGSPREFELQPVQQEQTVADAEQPGSIPSPPQAIATPENEFDSIYGEPPNDRVAPMDPAGLELDATTSEPPNSLADDNITRPAPPVSNPDISAENAPGPPNLATGDPAPAMFEEEDPATNGTDQALDVGPSLVDEGPAEPADQNYGRFLQSQIAGFEQGGSWMRAGPVDALLPDMHIRVPVAFDPAIIALGGAIVVNLDGRSALEVREQVQGGVPHFAMPFGRAIVSNLHDKRRVAVTVGDRLFVVELSDHDAKFAIEVLPFFLPGTDPATNRMSQVRIWPSEGRVILHLDGTETFVKEQEGVSITGNSEPVLEENIELPSWVDVRSVPPIMRNALARLDQLISTEQPVALSLTEIAQSNKNSVDLKSLSMRALVTFDQFGPIVQSLGDYKLRAYWQFHVEELQAAIARGSTEAELILDELRASYGPDASSIHRMLVGYSPDQLERNGASELVEALGHDELPYRVVAAVVLQQITSKTLHYKASDSAARRKGPISEWEERLLKNEIRYVAPPNPLGST